MEPQTLRERIAARRLARMREGQAACSIISLPSDPEIRLAIVPLTEAEYDIALSQAAALESPDNMAGVSRRDRHYIRGLLIQAVRNPDNLDEKVYPSIESMSGELESTDIDHINDEFHELTANSNPRLDGIPPEEFENLKETLQTMDWNALSGKSWHAARRFLGALITDGLLRDNSLGSSSTKPSTTSSE